MRRDLQLAVQPVFIDMVFVPAKPPAIGAEVQVILDGSIRDHLDVLYATGP